VKPAQNHSAVSALKSIDKSLSRIADSGEALLSLCYTVAQVYIAQQSALAGMAGGEKPEDLICSADDQIKKHLDDQRNRMTRES